MKTLPKTNGSRGRAGMPAEAVEEIAALYREHRSCSKVAKLTGRSRQSVHDVLQRRGLTNPNDIHGSRRKAGVIYKGERFTPERDGYLRSTKYSSRKAGQYRLLHKVIWEEHHGPIPKGMIVMFLDGNRQNCAIENLKMLTRKEARAGVFTGNGWTKYHQRKGELFSAWQAALLTGDVAEIQRTRAEYDALAAPEFRDLESYSRQMKRVWNNYTPQQRQARIYRSGHSRWGDRRVA